jgi:hypothetical protein
MTRSRMDDSHYHLKVFVEPKKNVPSDQEMSNCANKVGKLCSVLEASGQTVDSIDGIQNICWAWLEFRKKREPQGYTLPCVHLRAGLNQKKK